MYDPRGNILYKSDVGKYWYDAARPNRMTQVTLETASGATIPLTGTRALSYAFDDTNSGARTVNGVTVGNGNLQYTVSQDTVNSLHTVRGETYTSFNMPAQIQYGNFITSTTSSQDRTLAWVYGPEHQRIKEQVSLTGSGTSSYFAGATWYLNGIDSLGLSYEKEIRANGTTEQKHYVTAGGVVFALFTSRSGTLNGLPASSTSYMNTDHLGSVAVLTDETGAVVERLAYDPWGKRRNTTGTPDSTDSLVGVRTDRGYTMQEHLDEVGIIHMNGRIYDPLIGRFMSADPYVQAPTNLKTFNRYSYVWNNPLKMYDPEGFEAYPISDTDPWNHFVSEEPTGEGSTSSELGGSGSATSNSSDNSGNSSSSPPIKTVNLPTVTVSASRTEGLLNGCFDGSIACSYYNEYMAGRGAMPAGYLLPSKVLGDAAKIVATQVAVQLSGAALFKAATTGLKNISPVISKFLDSASPADKLAINAASQVAPPAGKLTAVLDSIGSEYAAQAPKSLNEAASLLVTATEKVGLEPGLPLASLSTTQQLVFSNPGGIITTVFSNGEILIVKGEQVLLHLKP